ncbi:MAG: serine hydrolase [Sphingobium sp.]|nr:serine hydrolase [Sphingobium sp.]
MKIKRLSSRSAFAVLAGAAAMLALAGYGWSRDAAPPAGYAVLSGDGAVSAETLKAVIDPLFDADATPTLGETRALIVMRDGKVIAERYAPGFGPESRMLTWSVAKTVTGLLVGIVVGDGRLALDDPASVAAWRQPGDPRAAITLRELMQMRSGLAHVELGEPREKADSLRMLVGDGASDQAGYAEAKPLIHPHGAHFTYSSATSMILSGIVANALTPSRDPRARHDAMAQFMKARLVGPLGLSGLVAEYDESGTMLGGAMMHMTARDYARIGELLRNHGRVGELQVVPERWIDFMTSPSPANPAYGGQLWLNRAGPQTELFPGEAPTSIFGAAGYRGQYVLVSPAQRLVVVRLGVTNEEDMPELRHALARLVTAMPR